MSQEFYGGNVNTTDYIGLLAVGVAILVGMPAVILSLKQSKEMNRQHKKEIQKLLNNKNWNNVGDISRFPYPTIEIEISSIDTAGVVRGKITNCESSCIETEQYTFSFYGELKSKGSAEITLCTSVGWREVPVGVAKIQYRSKSNTLEYHYLHDHQYNPHMSHELSLPRFSSYSLTSN